MPVTRRQAEKMKAKEEPYPTRTMRASAPKAEQKKNLVDQTQIPPEKDLRRLKRTDIQALAKKHKITANWKSERIIDALIRIREARQLHAQLSHSTGRSRRHDHQWDSESAEIPCIAPIASSSRLPQQDDSALEHRLTRRAVNRIPRQGSSERVESFLATLDLPPPTNNSTRNVLVETSESGTDKPQTTRSRRVVVVALYPTSPTEWHGMATAHRQATAHSTRLTITIPAAIRASQPTNRDLLSILHGIRPEPRQDSQPEPHSPPRMSRPTNRDLLKMHRRLKSLEEQRRQCIEALTQAETAFKNRMNQVSWVQQKREELDRKQRVYQEVLFPKLKELTELRDHHLNAELNGIPEWRQFLDALVDGEGGEGKGEKEDRDGDR